MVREDYKRPLAASLLAILFFLGTAAWPATGYGQTATGAGDYPPVILDGSWKVKQADSPEFSSPLYNDADWQTIQEPANTQEWFPDQSGFGIGNGCTCRPASRCMTWEFGLGKSPPLMKLM